jgi:hypothetical protein
MPQVHEESVAEDSRGKGDATGQELCLVEKGKL